MLEVFGAIRTSRLLRRFTRVSARSSYVWDEIRWDVKFASIFANGPDGVIAIDVERLSRTERLEEGATRTPAASESQSITVL